MFAAQTLKRKEPTSEEVQKALAIADTRAKEALRYLPERKKQKQEKARQQYQQASDEKKSEKNQKSNKMYRDKYANLKKKFDNAAKHRNHFPFNTEFKDFPLRFKYEHMNKFYDLVENGFVVLESITDPWYLTSYLEEAAAHNTIYHNQTAIFDTVEPKMPKNKRYVQKLRGGHPKAQNTQYGHQKPHLATTYAKKKSRKMLF